MLFASRRRTAKKREKKKKFKIGREVNAKETIKFALCHVRARECKARFKNNNKTTIIVHIVQLYHYTHSVSRRLQWIKMKLCSASSELSCVLIITFFYNFQFSMDNWNVLRDFLWEIFNDRVILRCIKLKLCLDVVRRC